MEKYNEKQFTPDSVYVAIETDRNNSNFESDKISEMADEIEKIKNLKDTTTFSENEKVVELANSTHKKSKFHQRRTALANKKVELSKLHNDEIYIPDSNASNENNFINGSDNFSIDTEETEFFKDSYENFVSEKRAVSDKSSFGSDNDDNNYLNRKRKSSVNYFSSDSTYDFDDEATSIEKDLILSETNISEQAIAKENGLYEKRSDNETLITVETKKAEPIRKKVQNFYTDKNQRKKYKAENLTDETASTLNSDENNAENNFLSEERNNYCDGNTADKVSLYEKTSEKFSDGSKEIDSDRKTVKGFYTDSNRREKYKAEILTGDIASTLNSDENNAENDILSEGRNNCFERSTADKVSLYEKTYEKFSDGLKEIDSDRKAVKGFYTDTNQREKYKAENLTDETASTLNSDENNAENDFISEEKNNYFERSTADKVSLYEKTSERFSEKEKDVKGSFTDISKKAIVQNDLISKERRNTDDTDLADNFYKGKTIYDEIENVNINSEDSKSKYYTETSSLKKNSNGKGKDSSLNKRAQIKFANSQLGTTVIFDSFNKINDLQDLSNDDNIAENIKDIVADEANRQVRNIYSSITVDKIHSENKSIAEDSCFDNIQKNTIDSFATQQFKETAKKNKKSQQYKLAAKAKETAAIHNNTVIASSTAKASASAAAKGIFTFFSSPAIPFIVTLSVIIIIAMFIWFIILLATGIYDGLIATTYMTTNKEITSATEYYSKLESELLADVNSEIERLNNDDDISKVETEFDVIEHNPEQLISYLCAVYPGFDFNGDVVNFLVTHLTGMPYYGSMKNVMKDMFDYQYSTEIKYTTYWVGKKKHTIATVYINNKGFDNTVEYFLQNLPEEYYEENVKEAVYTHYKQLREYRGNHGFWVDSPVNYDWRQYVVGFHGYETEDGGITSVSKGELLQNTDAGIEVTDEDLNHYDQKPLGLFTITGYCPCKICCGKYSPEVTGKPSTTASGTSPAANRTIAVDPKVIPLGSKVLINGHIYTAEDTGGAIKGNKIDIYYATHQEALLQGKQLNMAVFLLQTKTDITPDSDSTTLISDNNLASIALSEWEDKVSGIPNKYTKWFGEVGGTNIYNWCAVFVSWCVNEADMTDIVPITAEVSVLMENAKKSGIWREKEGYIPSPGDIMIQSNGASHTGIVVNATDTYFDTVEGNSGSNNIYTSKVGKYRYYYSDTDTLTGFIKTSDETSTGGSLYYKFTNYATGTDITKHRGIDIAGDLSTDVLAVIDGEVIEKTENSITIENEMYLIKYSSLKSITVNKGVKVTSGSAIAKMSDAENRGVPYVHIELIAQDGNEEMDPFIYCNIGSGTAPKISLANTLVNVGIGGGTVSAQFGNIHAPYTDEFASRAVVTSSFFDTYHSSFHRAIDLDVTYGSNVGIAAAWDGKVVLVGSGSGNGLTGYGYVVVLEHVIDGVKVYTKYNHMKMNSSSLKVGDVVAAGDQIGIQGATGNVSGEHLDFQIGICSNSYNWSEFSNNLVNPIAIYQGWTQSINSVSIWNSSGGCVRKGDDYNQTRLVNNMSGKHIF